MFVLADDYQPYSYKLDETANVEKNLTSLANGERITDQMRTAHEEYKQQIQILRIKIVHDSILTLTAIAGLIFNIRKFFAAQKFSQIYFSGAIYCAIGGCFGFFFLDKMFKSRSAYNERLNIEIDKVKKIYSEIIKDIRSKLENKQKEFISNSFALVRADLAFINNLKLAIKETKEEEKLIHTIWEEFKKSANEYISFIDSINSLGKKNQQ